LIDVGLDHLVEEGATAPIGVSRDKVKEREKWMKNSKSMYSKLCQCVKAVAQDVVLQYEGQEDCGVKAWRALKAKFEGSTRTRRTKLYKMIHTYPWDGPTDPDRVLMELLELQRQINGMVVNGRKYEVTEEMLMDIIISIMPEEVYGALQPVIDYDDKLSYEDLCGLIRAQYRRMMDNDRNTLGLYAKSKWKRNEFNGTCFYCLEKEKHMWKDCPKYLADLKKPCGNCGMTGKCVAKWCKKPSSVDKDTPKKVSA
jgi:hypothetical protein